jgi:hypothetical protein
MYLPVSKDILDSVSQRCAALLLVLKRIRRFPHGAAFVQVVIRLQYPFQTWRAVRSLAAVEPIQTPTTDTSGFCRSFRK